MTMGELNLADRYLLWRLQPTAQKTDEVPTEQEWQWRYREPPAVTAPHHNESVDMDEIVEWTSSCGELERKGMLWHGHQSTKDGMSTRQGWGATEAGLRAYRAIRESDEPQRWVDAARFWDRLREEMKLAIHPQPSGEFR